IAIVLPILPTFVHIKNRNWPAFILALWLILLNIFTFVNSIVWSGDDVTKWWDGYGFCDLEIRFFISATIGIMSCVIAITRNLSIIVSREGPRVYFADTKAQRRKRLAIDLSICIVPFIILNAVYYVIQPYRFFLVQNAGCTAPNLTTWLGLVLNVLWGPIAALIASGYAILTVCRYLKRRRDFEEVMLSSSSTSSHFFRLLLFSSLIVLIMLPLSLYVLYLNTSMGVTRFSWSEVHSLLWGMVPRLLADGAPVSSWFTVVGSYLFFIFFGFGNDAVILYKGILKRV
ncbi:hypothetical protein CANCADRAFT_17331, partial [Tortispora caseinolytica NRRL Y-17796]